MNAPSFTHLDDPFVALEHVEHLMEVDDDWLEELAEDETPARHATLHPPAAATPTGSELIFGNECDEPTRIYPPGYIESLLAEASVHTHGTVRAMRAVKLKKVR